MKPLRIRSITKNGASSWIYIQEQQTKEAPKPVPFMAMAAAIQPKSRTNQYGRFRYSEYQYGKLERMLASSLELSKKPIRIRNQAGEWVYTDHAEVNGACPAIRIRSRSENQTGPWVYIQQQEV